MNQCNSCGCRPCCDNGMGDICRGVNCIASGVGKGICCGINMLSSIACPPRPCCRPCCNSGCNSGFNSCCRPCPHPPACRCRCVCRCERVCD